MVLIIFELASIVIWCIMKVEDALKDILKDYDPLCDGRDILLGLMAIFGGWLFAPYFAWLMYKWIGRKGEKNENH